jgi:hypothetical protein
MALFDIEQAIPSVPGSVSPLLANSQAGALSFLRNVLQIDLDKYKVTLSQDYIEPSDAGYQTEYILYQLHNSQSSATVDFEISNSSVTNCNIYNANGKLFNTTLSLSNYYTATRIMQTYQAWTRNSEVGKMVALLNKAGSGNNVTETSGNIDLKITNVPGYSTFDWHYTYNGADYTGVTLWFGNNGNMAFSDNRAIFSIGDTTIYISKEQAVKIAESYVMENVSYAYTFENGTKATIKNFIVNNSSATASLETAAKASSALYPYWSVQVPLDHAYPGSLESVTVWVWADSGDLFGANYGPIYEVPYPFYVSSLALFEGFLIAIVVAAVVVVVVLAVVLSKSKTKQNLDIPRSRGIKKTG